MIGPVSWCSSLYCTSEAIFGLGGISVIDSLPAEASRTTRFDVLEIEAEPGDRLVEIDKKILLAMNVRPKRAHIERERQFAEAVHRWGMAAGRHLALIVQNAHLLHPAAFAKIHVLHEFIEETAGRRSSVVLVGDLCALIAAAHAASSFMLRVKLFVPAHEVCRKAA